MQQKFRNTIFEKLPFFRVFTNRVLNWPQFNASTIDHYLDSFFWKTTIFQVFNTWALTWPQFNVSTMDLHLVMMLKKWWNFWKITRCHYKSTKVLHTEEKKNSILDFIWDKMVEFFRFWKKMYQVESTSMPAPTVLGVTYWREEKFQF